MSHKSKLTSYFPPNHISCIPKTFSLFPLDWESFFQPLSFVIGHIKYVVVNCRIFWYPLMYKLRTCYKFIFMNQFYFFPVYLKNIERNLMTFNSTSQMISCKHIIHLILSQNCFLSTTFRLTDWQLARRCMLNLSSFYLSRNCYIF